MMTATAGDYANLPDALRAATGRLSASSQSARIAAAEAVAQLWQSQGEVITGHQLAAICHAAHTAADGHSGPELSAVSHAVLEGYRSSVMCTAAAGRPARVRRASPAPASGMTRRVASGVGTHGSAPRPEFPKPAALHRVCSRRALFLRPGFRKGASLRTLALRSHSPPQRTTPR